jgi:hypothetical protein
MPQNPPGVNPALDTAKVAAFRAASAAVAPLRRSEGMRRAIRRLVKGRDANYYYREAGKQDAKAS